MKNTATLILMSLPTVLYSEDSLFVEITGDTVFICDYNAWVQCAFQLECDVTVNDSIITITEIDTAADMTTCYGYRNFRMPILGLQEGSYHVDIYRDDLYQDVRFIGSFSFTYIINSINEITSLPSNFTLYDPYPNPFNPTTKVKYYIPLPNYIDINLYDLVGRKIKTLVKNSFVSGIQELTIDGSNLSSGIYFIVFTSENVILSKKIVLIK